MSENSSGFGPKNQFAAGLFLMVWSVIGWLSLIGSPALWVNEYGVDPGPSLLPIISLTILSLGDLALIGTGALQTVVQQHARTRYWAMLIKGALMPGLFAISLIVYITLIDVVGFIPMSAIFSITWMYILGVKSGNRTYSSLLPLVAIGTFIGVGLIYFVFLYLIGVPIG